MLNFTKGNAKLGKHIAIFNLPAGKTCPGARFCKSFVSDENGKRRIQDGKETIFRCFAASSEVQYDATFQNRKNNMEIIVSALKISMEECAKVIDYAINFHRTKNTQLVRIHESGDFFSRFYLEAWITVARNNPDLKFYCYSKSLPFFLTDDLDANLIDMPDNFFMTASYGGQWDHLIDRNYFPRYAKVFKFEEEAISEGLEVDHDDTHCFGDSPFALLVHGTQPKGSVWGAAIRDRRKAKQFAGYSK